MGNNTGIKYGGRAKAKLTRLSRVEDPYADGI